MGFNSKNWNSTTLTTSDLNRIEKGIKDSHDTLDLLGEEVSALQLRQISNQSDIKTLLKDTPTLAATLNEIENLLNKDNKVLETIRDINQLVTKQELDARLFGWIKITDIKQDGNSIYDGDSIINIKSKPIDTSLDINSNNAISNKAVTKALNNLNLTGNIPTKLAELSQDSLHQTVTASEKSKWNSILETLDNIILTETDPTVPDWAKQKTKPYYDYAEIINTPSIPTKYSDLQADITYLKVAPVTTVNNKQGDIIIYGTDIKLAENNTSNITNTITGHKEQIETIKSYIPKTASTTNMLADIQYVKTQIASLVGSAPDTLDTLEEVAKAIEENETVVDALNAAIGTKVNKADIEPTIQFAETERQKSKNLLNKDLLKKGCYLFLTGKYDYNSDYMTSEPISVTPNSTITISCNGFEFNSNCGFVFFNNGVFVSYLSNGARVATVPSNANQVIYDFFKVGITKDDVQYAQLEYGSMITDYQPYNGAIVHEKTLQNNPAIAFAESERQKSKNLYNAEAVPITSSYVTYDKDTNTFTYTVNNTIESSSTSLEILKYGKLKPGTYTMSFNTTSTIGNTAPVIVAKLDEYDNFSSSITTKNIIDGYVYLTFTLNEETNIGLAWYYKAGWISGDAPPGVKTLTNLQLEEGSIATDYQSYNGATVHEEQLKDYLPLSGGTMAGAILFPGTATYSTTTQPTALSYGRLQAYGTLNINANTDNSGTEYVNITAGHGCSSSTADGLSIGTDTLTWKNQPIALTSDIIPKWYNYTIDASSLNVNTWYPVTIQLDVAKSYIIEVCVALNSGTKPSWATHGAGFSVRKRWVTQGCGWGTQIVNRYIFDSNYTFCDSDPVRGLTQMTRSSTEVVYVRGGGKYHFFIDAPLQVTLRTSTYTVSDESVSPVTTAPAEIKQDVMTTNTEQTITANKIFTGTVRINGTIIV